MNIEINGESRTFECNSKQLILCEVIEELGHHPKMIVVEFNGYILHPSLWETQVVQDGDRIEIVTIVGGGS